MKFIQGHALLRTKCDTPHLSPITEVVIVDFCEMILETDHILTDEMGRIVTFQCKEGSRQFKGIIKYRTKEDIKNIKNKDKECFNIKNKDKECIKNKEDIKNIKNKEDKWLDFKLLKNDSKSIDDKSSIVINGLSSSNCSIVINGLSYSICTTPSLLPITRIYFKNNQLITEKEENYKKSNEKLIDKKKSNEKLIDKKKTNEKLIDKKKTNEKLIDKKSIEVIKINLNSSSLLDIIISNLPKKCSYHSSLSYFCFSSVDTFFGFIFCYYLDGYHFYSVVLLSALYNPLDLFHKPLEEMNDVLLFDNNCFMISDGGNELYMSSRIQIDFNYDYKLINKIIGSILSEERICFISKQDVFLKIMYFLEYIKPFKWSHSLVITNNEGGDEILRDSPLPFIFGRKYNSDKDSSKDYDNRDKNLLPSSSPFFNSVTIDLDSFLIKNNNLEVKATKDFTLRLAKYFDLKKKYMLEKYPDNIQNILLYSHRYFREQGVLSFFPEDADYSRDFIDKFTSTRMFIRYIVEERLSPIDYIFDIRSKLTNLKDKEVTEVTELKDKYELIPFMNILDYNTQDIIKAYVMIYDLENNELTDKIYNYDKDNEFRECLLRRLSIKKDYSSISGLIKNSTLSLSESHRINVYEKQNILKISKEDIEGMSFVNICDFMSIDDINNKINIQDSTYTKNSTHTRNSINTRNSIDNKINLQDSVFHSSKPHDKNKCKFKTIIIKGNNTYHLYPLSSLVSIFLSMPQVDFKVEYPEIFYNLVGYFYYFELPFNCEVVDYKI